MWRACDAKIAKAPYIHRHVARRGSPLRIAPEIKLLGSCTERYDRYAFTRLAGVANLIEGIFGEKFASQLEMYAMHMYRRIVVSCVCASPRRERWPVDAADPRRTSNRIGDVCAHSDGHEVLT